MFKKMKSFVSFAIVVSLIATSAFGTSQKKENRNYGYVPSEYEMDNTPLDFGIKTDLPAKFSLKEQGRLTDIRDQGQEGACWAFAAIASLESRLMPTENKDFSEDNLARLHGFDWKIDDGGNRDIATAYFASGKGPVLEADDPYGDGVANPNAKQVKQIKDIAFLPDKDYTTIKSFVYNYGAVYTTINAVDEDTDYFNSETNAQFYNGSDGSNHAVAIVGWDDNYSKDNFGAIKPLNDGAFIIKNSWGSWWGNEGFFYVSYEDVLVGKENMCILSVENTDMYDKIYDLSPFNALGSYSTDTFANVFTRNVQEEETLTAIGIHTNSANVGYSFYLKDGIDDKNDISDAHVVAEGTFLYPGYHIVELNSKELLSSSKFAISAELSSDYGYPAAIEQKYNGYATEADADPGESFYFNGINWVDLNSAYDANYTIKAYIKEENSSEEVDTQILQAKIAEAKTLISNAPNNIGFPKVNLQTVVTQAEELVLSSTKTETQVNGMVTSLNSAVNTYNSELKMYQSELNLKAWSNSLQVPNNHVFKITFNKEVKLPSASQIFLRNANRELVGVTLSLTEDNKGVLITPNSEYSKENHTIFIKGIVDTNGETLKTDIKALFSVN